MINLLLLLSYIRTGVSGEDGLIFAGRSYDITFPCLDDFVCVHVWNFDIRETSDYAAIVTNGEIQMFGFQGDDSICALQIKDLTEQDVGRHRCQQRPVPSATLENTYMPGKVVSLQCILLAYVEQGHCYTEQQQHINLMWVDEAGAEIQKDAQHHIEQRSHCDVTLTVALQSLGNKRFRCRMTADGQVQTSVEFPFRVPGRKGRGGGFILEPGTEDQGHNPTGVAVGVVGCMGLVALVAAFVVQRRRANRQLPDESYSNGISTISAVNTDDVIYADVIHYVGSDRVRFEECESTEYACIRYK
ncbi:uncharacterized protein LOC124999243 [Mugil cephalus]|uniref:uncharacterized protein LOC124999243 n=1 Tax=Mugil cephalus TaxID=48193 RepID=UPI001FB72A78|nr:uncharacterized protein LOC124999243 [Mugil cephalus]